MDWIVIKNFCSIKDTIKQLIVDNKQEGYTYNTLNQQDNNFPVSQRNNNLQEKEKSNRKMYKLYEKAVHRKKIQKNMIHEEMLELFANIEKCNKKTKMRI